MPALFLLFSHSLTEDQQQDATTSLGVTRIVPLPEDLQQRWSQVPPELPDVANHALPIWNWLAAEASAGDYVLIQGDFGMTYSTVNYTLNRSLIPVYATTIRQSKEISNKEGQVTKTLVFRHVRFRRYEPEQS